MHNTLSLCENYEFKRVYKRGKSVAADLLVLYYLKNRQNVNRLGITVTKKLGKAVVRNRARRLIKEAFRLSEHKVSIGYDIVIVARNKIVDRSHLAEVKRALDYALRTSGLS